MCVAVVTAHMLATVSDSRSPNMRDVSRSEAFLLRKDVSCGKDGNYD